MTHQQGLSPGADDISEIVVPNAQELHKGPVARVRMRRRVPFGFHGLWVPENSEF
ncbi:MAG TPA: hypothetical protein EYN06_01490 [Myxococcales bacterium]|nr:hypothetical protein [Myxococcales bacterium]HIN85123.1 hypothetical protein [Myxococcales bacterium]